MCHVVTVAVLGPDARLWFVAHQPQWAVQHWFRATVNQLVANSEGRCYFYLFFKSFNHLFHLIYLFMYFFQDRPQEKGISWGFKLLQ